MIVKVFDFLKHGQKPIQALVIRRNHPKTLMCEVEQREYNKTKYGGVFTKRRNFMAHDEHEQARIGDIVRIKHSRKYSTKKYHVVYDILKPHEGQTYMEQHPEFKITGSERKDRKKRDRAFEMSLQDPLTQMRYTREQEEKEKKAVADRLERLQKRNEARQSLKQKKEGTKETSQKAGSEEKSTKDEKKNTKAKATTKATTKTKTNTNTKAKAKTSKNKPVLEED